MKHWSSIEAPFTAAQRQVIRLPPTAVLALLFLVLIVVATALLLLPGVTTRPFTWMEALFTAASAVTVTGLAVVDAGSDLTRTGQWLLLAFIQLGGLGIMTFTVMVLALLGQRLGIRQQLVLKEDLNQTSLGDLMRLVVVIAAVVGAAEAAGTLALAVRLVPEFGWGEGLFRALFHAVSAFNNAGIALWPDGLVRYATDGWVNFVLIAMVLLGSIGFSVIDEVANRRRWRALSLHTRLTLVGTAALVVWATVMFAALEWHNPRTLGQHAGVADRLLVSLFQAVSFRTAGLNTVDVSALTDATAFMTMSQMFIGGSSTSTAGGIKVSSFMVLVIATLAFLRGSTSPSAFGRTVSTVDMLRVLALVFLSLIVAMFGVFLLVATQEGSFLDLMFEAVSATGTTGLSRGTTTRLDDFGRGVLVVIMFLGRIGPLALGLMLARGTADAIRYPEGRVYLG
ncbi:TrkH family potassium uptake protein [Methylibium rhizosphaerae]|uniref:TrkH family potassium uptake protein n=1 Tax=Methylibium rhizosphaerae TaxID=2570323 RepID=UPI001C613A69|nr:potassium transporter TrkG [Methylibium rhizosphaerae]